MSRKITNKVWLDKRAHKLQKIKYHRKNKKSISHSTNINTVENNKEKYYLASSKIYKAVPKKFSLIENTDETINFFGDIIDEIQKRIYKRTFFIDSASVDYVTVDALIYLIAIMQNVQTNFDMLYTFKGNLPENKDAAFVYNNSGFMSYVSSDVKKLPRSTDNMRIVSNNVNSPTITKELCQFIMEKLHKERCDVLSVQKVLIELMSNVYHHAYNDDDIMRKHWYLYAEYIDNRVRCIFLDTGASIAKTVRKNFIEKLKRITGVNSSDSELIHSTLRGDFRTKTGENYRGNGLSGVRELAETDLFENFTVLSGSGVCFMKKDNTIEKRDYDNKICGTIYMFDVI